MAIRGDDSNTLYVTIDTGSHHISVKTRCPSRKTWLEVAAALQDTTAWDGFVKRRR
jgi:hypothetical protein